MSDLIFIILALSVSYFTGTLIEKKHYRSIREREARMLTIPMLNHSMVPEPEQVIHTELVSGSVVISADYFKKTLAGLWSLFGGNIAVAESVIDRARREAVLRMREQARDAKMVIQMRIQTTEVSAWQVEAVAYGTALYYHE